MKTRTEYQTEKKRLKVPKVEEFTISFTDGVSERLKVRTCGKERTRLLCFLLPSFLPFLKTPTALTLS